MRVKRKVFPSIVRTGAEFPVSLLAMTCSVGRGGSVKVRHCAGPGSLAPGLTCVRKALAAETETSSRYRREMMISPFKFTKNSPEIMVPCAERCAEMRSYGETPALGHAQR